MKTSLGQNLLRQNAARSSRVQLWRSRTGPRRSSGQQKFNARQGLTGAEFIQFLQVLAEPRSGAPGLSA
jgi:hypothetical protein